MRIQSRHKTADHPLGAYFSPPEAIAALLALERLPPSLIEPAAGDGAMVRPLRAAGHRVFAADIADYGFPLDHLGDSLVLPPLVGIAGMVTNPPFALALRFAEKFTNELPFVAMLLRTNFLESAQRMSFFRRQPPSRVWLSSRRLPMMHRHGWTGKTAGSNTAHAWFIWDRSAEKRCVLGWFDWKEKQR